nr:hypothetical protein [uncultured Flavobacterium sp.]
MIALLAIAVVTVSCSTTKGVESTNWLGKKVTMISVAPENGKVTATREFEKGLNLNGFKELYPQTHFDPEKVLVEYSFDRNKTEGNYADDFYKEELFLEIPAQKFKKQYKDDELEQVKLVYGKHCYCKGEAGYFKITEGTLKVDHSEKQTKVKLTFKAPSSSVIENVEFVVE